MKNVFLKNLKWIVLFACITSFLIILIDVIRNDITSVDENGYLFISKYLILDSITPFVKFFTNFGGEYFLICFAIILFLVVRNKKIGASIICNLALVSLINYILKLILHRTRPIDNQLIDVSGYSFPSGHAMIGLAFYGFIIYLIYKNVKNKYIRNSSIIVLSLLVLVIGISRIYLGVHYTSDVLAGFLLGIVYLILYVKITNKYINRM